MKKIFDKETIIKLLIIFAILVIVFFLLSIFIKNIKLEVVLFGFFCLFLIFNYQSDKNKKTTVSIKTIDKKEVSSNKANTGIKEVKKDVVKEVYKDSKSKSNTPNKQENNITSRLKQEKKEEKKEEKTTSVIVKKDESKKEKEKEKEREKETKTEVKYKEVIKDKDPVKLVLSKDKPKDAVILKNKDTKKEDKINVKNLKVGDKKKLNESKITKSKGNDAVSNIVLGSSLYNAVSNNSKKEKLTNEENLACAELSLFLLGKNKDLTSIPYRKGKDGFISIDSTDIKFKADEKEKYMLVPKDKVKDKKLKESAFSNGFVKVPLDNIDAIEEYLFNESMKIKQKKYDRYSLLSLFPFTRKLSERIIKRKKEKEKKLELLRIYKLYDGIASLYHKAGDYDKEILFLSKAINRLKNNGFDTSLLESKLYEAKLLAKETEIGKVKKKVKEKDKRD